MRAAVKVQIFCWLLGTCRTDSSYGVTDRYISIEGYIPGADNCYKAPKCNSSYIYRQPDGTCNNLQHPTWGSAETVYMRLLPAYYQDGDHEIKKAKNGGDLPNVRRISSTLYPDINVADKSRSLALMQWGQVVTHDSALSRFPILDCCPNGQFPNKPIQQCSPISVPKDDPFYSRFNVTCMSYTRVHTTESAQNCPLKPHQQFSYVTQWLDLSLIYGSAENVSDSIRERKGGLFKVEEVDGEVTLPITHERQDFCRITSPQQPCLNTGDVRVNQNPHLATLSVVLVREHNRVAGQLAKINPSWDDERIFQESKRVVIATAQHITYSEYLPHILAPQYIHGMKLLSLKSGFTTYDSSIRGGTLNEFTGSAFRTFHTTVQGELRLLGGSSGKCPMTRAKLGDLWWTSGDIAIKCFEQLSKGLLAQKARLYHRYETVQQTQNFQKGERKYGDDMEAKDMMRGRDQGIAPYNQYRKVCGLTTFDSFQDLTKAIPKVHLDKLKKLYSSVDDVDLFVGGILETPVATGLTGPTVQCIMAQQFARWKFGDRFYYEHQNQAGSFSKAQLDAIRKTTFSSLMCQNTKIGSIQKQGFLQESSTNKKVSCKSIPVVDLSSWKE